MRKVKERVYVEFFTVGQFAKYGCFVWMILSDFLLPF